MAEHWSDYTDFVLTSIDKKISTKYKISLKKLLSGPSKFSSQPNIQATIKNLAEEVNSFIDTAIASMPDAKKALADSVLKADAVTRQLSQNISMQAKQHKVPVVTPVSIIRDETKEEIISVNDSTPDVLALVEKLAASSMLVADFSYAYQNASIGSWLFSGHKNYILEVFVPDNDVAMLEASRIEITDLLAAAGVMIAGV